MESAFQYKNGGLCAENVALEKIASDVGTPLYVYSKEQLTANYRAFHDAFEGQNATICYAIKANSNQAVIQTLAECGAGGDVTSVGELERALAAGISPKKIVYSGVGKRRDEILAALIAGIHQFNVESIPELHLINEVAKELKTKAPVAIRVNPDINSNTYDKTATGHKETKFGIEIANLDEAMGLAMAAEGLRLQGFAMHIGSNVSDHEPYKLAFQVLRDLVMTWRAKGATILHLDLGGGLNLPYRGEKVASLEDYAVLVREIIGPLNCKLAFEPGRLLVGNAGLLLSRVIYPKKAVAKKFLVIDAGMNDLVRPAMYGAHHDIIPLKEPNSADAVVTWDVVGPVCETSDLFDENYVLPDLKAGDLVAVVFAGAYGSSMSSTYNGRTLIPEVMVSGGDYAIIRRRISVAEQMSWECLPHWMQEKKQG